MIDIVQKMVTDNAIIAPGQREVKEFGLSEFRSNRIPNDVTEYNPLPDRLSMNGKEHDLLLRTVEVYLYKVGRYHYEVGVIDARKPDKYCDKWRERPMSNDKFGLTYGKALRYTSEHRVCYWFWKYVEEVDKGFEGGVLKSARTIDDLIQNV